MGSLETAVAAARAGELVVYPTETVYGLGGNALRAATVDAVFEAKGRPRNEPMALAVPSVEAALEHVVADARTRAFMEAFLPGPVTVVCRKREPVPDVLTGGRDRVGVRVPDHDAARSLLAQTPPLTATSANVSGGGSAHEVADIDTSIRRAAGAVIDGGRTPGGASTVVDVERGRIHRCGRRADAIQRWLDEAA